MNKKIKIIELFDIVANGRKIPKQIKFRNLIYRWDKYGYLHYSDEDTAEQSFLEGIRTEMVLNDYVEILEDNIEEIEELPDYNYSIKENRDKINELVKAVNQITINLANTVK